VQSLELEGRRNEPARTAGLLSLLLNCLHLSSIDMETRGEREKETEIQIAKEEEKRDKEKKNVRRTGREDQLPLFSNPVLQNRVFPSLSLRLLFFCLCLVCSEKTDKTMPFNLSSSF